MEGCEGDGCQDDHDEDDFQYNLSKDDPCPSSLPCVHNAKEEEGKDHDEEQHCVWQPLTRMSFKNEWNRSSIIRNPHKRITTITTTTKGSQIIPSLMELLLIGSKEPEEDDDQKEIHLKSCSSRCDDDEELFRLFGKTERKSFKIVKPKNRMRAFLKVHVRNKTILK